MPAEEDPKLTLQQMSGVLSRIGFDSTVELKPAPGLGYLSTAVAFSVDTRCALACSRLSLLRFFMRRCGVEKSLMLFSTDQVFHVFSIVFNDNGTL